MTPRLAFAPLAICLLVGACATMPSGPSVTVLPGTGKTPEAFQQDSFDCQQFAQASSGGKSATDVANENAVGNSALGAGLGAAAGAIIGSASGQAGPGAAIGAGIGLLTGAAAASNTAPASYYAVQRRYDSAYLQCMYARGNRIPVRTSYGYNSPPVYSYPPAQSAPPASSYPSAYPPPNYPPPNYPPPNTPPPKG
jgi:hypothetical protein